MNTEESAKTERPRVALITNHGYAGVEIPVGGAPDTGGQNFYVNSLADAFATNGFAVTIFARGGFPFFSSDRLREGQEMLSRHVRYVYVPGGGERFIRKEDIAIALDEEVAWLERFVAQEAAAAGVEPWRYYELVNTHYWDAAIMGLKLVERWQDEVARGFLKKAAGGVLAESLSKFEGDGAHRHSLSRELALHLGEAARVSVGSSSPAHIAEVLTGNNASVETHSYVDARENELLKSISIGRQLINLLRVNGQSLKRVLKSADTHVWTPHSLGIVKERNFWDKDEETVRALKFRERDAHEQVICRRTPLFCSTSQEIWRGLVSYHGVEAARVFDFPPCIDSGIFRPRRGEELTRVYEYMAAKSGIDADHLRSSLIVFETSRMDRTKRKDILLRAFAEVVRSCDDVYLFIGGGPEGSPVFEELAQLKASLGELEGRAFLLGFIPDEHLETMFSAADLFVSASEMEGFGMSASQAAAAGVAVVASDLIPFATQFAKDAAWVVPAGDVTGFAKAMQHLLTHREEREQRAGKLLEIAGDFNWIRTAERFYDWYREHLG